VLSGFASFVRLFGVSSFGGHDPAVLVAIGFSPRPTVLPEVFFLFARLCLRLPLKFAKVPFFHFQFGPLKLPSDPQHLFSFPIDPLRLVFPQLRRGPLFVSVLFNVLETTLLLPIRPLPLPKIYDVEFFSVFHPLLTQVHQTTG